MSGNKFPDSSPSKYMDLSFQEGQAAGQPSPIRASLQHPPPPQPQMSTGWTPIIGRTTFQTFPPTAFVPDNFGLLPLTPSAPSAAFSRAGCEFDLGEMPFMTSTTPFRDRSFHINDFMFDSPVIHTNSTTASAVKQGTWFKENVPPTNQKRSITALDTPPRQATKAVHKSLKSPFGEDFETPLKSNLNRVLPSEMDNTRTPLVVRALNESLSQSTPARPSQGPGAGSSLATPARPLPQSSPSTIIIASAKALADGHIRQTTVPASPTPAHPTDKKKRDQPLDLPYLVKDARAPVMGTFSGPAELKARDESFSHLRNLSSDKAGGLAVTSAAASKPASMQAGMSKFQIIFTDVKSLLNSKGKGKAKSKGKRLARSNTTSAASRSEAGVIRPSVGSAASSHKGVSETPAPPKPLSRSLSAPQNPLPRKGNRPLEMGGLTTFPVPASNLITPQKLPNASRPSSAVSASSSTLMSAQSCSTARSAVSTSSRNKSTGITPLMQQSMVFGNQPLHETPSLSRSVSTGGGSRHQPPSFHYNTSVGSILYGQLSNLSVEYSNDFDSPRTKELQACLNTQQSGYGERYSGGSPPEGFALSGHSFNVRQLNNFLGLHVEESPGAPEQATKNGRSCFQGPPGDGW